MEIILLFILTGGILIYCLYLIKKYNYWRERDIPCAKGLLPGFGHMWPVLSLKMNIADLSQKIYDNYSGHSMIGFYNKTVPALVIREPELIKTVIQTNFMNFSENLLKVDPHLDFLLAQNPFFSVGDTWMTSRKRLVHAFSGIRLKMLFNCIEQVCKKFENYLNQELEKNNGVLDIELKDLFSRYTGEVVANAGFGLEGFCFQDKAHPASFYAFGKSFFEQNIFSRIVQTLIFFLPELSRIFRISFLPRKEEHFLRNTVKEVLQIRQQENVRRNDFFQLMVDLEKTENGDLDEKMLTAHILSFFVDGFETSSITLSFIGYQLAHHPHVQQKLREEVETVLDRYDGSLIYESLKEMTYMDQVISESQRLYTALGSIGKVCTKEFELKGSDGLCCRVQPGTEIVVPVYGLHRDSKYWSNPNVFDPDRFHPDRKSKIEKFTFLPFGEGPRICVGMRMGLLQMKACLATIVTKYRLEISPKTQESLKILSGNFLTIPVGGLWVYVKHL